MVTKGMWAQIEETYSGRVKLVVLDFTNETNTEASRVEAGRLGLEEFFKEYAGATGTIVVLDGRTRQVTASISGSRDFAEYRAAIDAALAASRDSPGSVVERFYATYLTARQGGLPSGGQLERLRPFLSDNLHRSIVAALQYQEQFIAAHPARPSPAGPPVALKPPFVDGDYFSSLFEGPKSFKVVEAVAVPGGSWKVQVHFWYDTSLAGWEDAVIVTEQGGRYVIDDVLFSGAGSFNPSGRLSDSLKYREDQ
jgi:hypothetical protein